MPTALVAFVAMLILALAILSANAWWASDLFVTLTVYLCWPIWMLSIISLCSIGMRLCDVRVYATQFIVYMALSNLGISISSAAMGPLDRLGGYYAIFATVVVIGIVGMVLAHRISPTAAYGDGRNP